MNGPTEAGETPAPRGKVVPASLKVEIEEEDRYSRLRLIPWWDQQLLHQARVMVVGAGALGNEIVKNLTLLGVGRLFIADLDRIENSNLSRSVLYRQSNEGEHKALTAAVAAREMNPDVTAQPFVGNIVHDLGMGVFRAMDVIIGGLDNREARLHINQCCWRVNRPWVDGAIEAVHGIARVFVPPDSACYECTMSEMDYQLLNKRKSCALLTRSQMLEGKTPTTPTTSAVIAGIQCQEAIKLLHHERGLPTLAGKGFFFEGMSHDSFVIEYPRKEDCLSHDTFEDIIETEWRSETATLGEVLAQARQDLGPQAILDLHRDVVTEFTCAKCGTAEPCFRLLGRLTEDDARCAQCQEMRRWDSTHVVTGREPYLERTLGEIGVPAFDIISGLLGEETTHYELTGDRAEVLGSIG